MRHQPTTALEQIINFQDDETSTDPRGVPVPKSWFADPQRMIENIGLGYQHSPSTVTYETLRQMATRNSIIAAIIQTRVNQVAAFCQPQRNEYQVGFDFRHRDPDHKITASDKDLVKKLRHMMLNCGQDYSSDRDDFEMFTRKVIRDRLRWDQLNFEKVPRWDGLPASFVAVDASTIRIARPKTKHDRPLTEDEAREVAKYVQIVDGVVVNEYTKDEMAFGIANPRTDIAIGGYGQSELELLITTVTYHLFAEQWNQKVFSQGATTKGLVNLKGPTNKQRLEDFKRQWLTQISGVANAWRTPITNFEDVQWIPLQPSNQEMGYQQWMEYLIKIASAIYLIDPAEINFDLRGSSQNQPMFMTQNEAQQKVSKDRGLQPLLRFYFNLLNRHIIWPYTDQWEIIPKGLDAKTEEQAINNRQKSLQSHRTLNEVRAEEGLSPVEHGDVVLNPVYVSVLQQREQQAAAAQQMQAQAQQGGQPGPQQSPMMAQQGDQEAYKKKLMDNSDDLGTESAQAGEAMNRLASPDNDSLRRQFDAGNYE